MNLLRQVDSQPLVGSAAYHLFDLLPQNRTKVSMILAESGSPEIMPGQD
jgi:hypothetical protein